MRSLSADTGKRAALIRKTGLALFGVVLGSSIAVLILALPDSPPLARVQALWQPAFRDIREGAAALKEGQNAGAESWFDQAVQTSEHSANRQTVLDMVVDSCGRHQAWALAEKYARTSMQRRGSPVDELRYAEALIGGGDPRQAQGWLEKLLKAPPAPEAGRRGAMVYELAERDLALVLAASGRDLGRSQRLAEDSIRREVKSGNSGQMLAELNDALAWAYFKQALAARTAVSPAAAASRLASGPTVVPVERTAPSVMELARIYAESAVDFLDESTDPPVAATALFHLSQIEAAEGRTEAAADPYRAAVKASAKTVRWLDAEANREAAQGGQHWLWTPVAAAGFKNGKR